MEIYKMPTGETVVLTGSPESNAREKEIFGARYKFSIEYAYKQGWGPIQSLSIPQILEIRKQKAWIHPLSEEA